MSLCFLDTAVPLFIDRRGACCSQRKGPTSPLNLQRRGYGGQDCPRRAHTPYPVTLTTDSHDTKVTKNRQTPKCLYFVAKHHL